MYDICRYEQAWHVERVSVWCAVSTMKIISPVRYWLQEKQFDV